MPASSVGSWASGVAMPTPQGGKRVWDAGIMEQMRQQAGDQGTSLLVPERIGLAATASPRRVRVIDVVHQNPDVGIVFPRQRVRCQTGLIPGTNDG